MGTCANKRNFNSRLPCGQFCQTNFQDRSLTNHSLSATTQPAASRISVIYNWFHAPCHSFSIYRSFVCSLPRCGVFDTSYLRFFDSSILGNKFHHKSPLKIFSWHNKICICGDTRRLSECSPFAEVARKKIRETKTRDIFFHRLLFDLSLLLIEIR